MVGLGAISLIVILTLAAGIMAAPLAANAQQPARVFRLGILGNDPTPPWEAFRQRLTELGYVEGVSLVVEARWSEGKTDRFPAFAEELVRLNVDVIFASGTAAALAAKRATSTIPIVMTVVADPVGSGLVASLARPGGNITGFSNIAPELSPKRFELIKELVPKAARVAVLWSGTPPDPVHPMEHTQAAQVLGMRLQPVLVRTPDDFEEGFSAIRRERPDALYVYGNPTNFNGRALIIEFAARQRLPAIYEERLFVQAGGLVSYAPSFIDLFRRGAGYVDRIFKGAKPADLPVERPAKFELVINVKTAKALGLRIPQSIILRADQVIE